MHQILIIVSVRTNNIRAHNTISSHKTEKKTNKIMKSLFLKTTDLKQPTFNTQWVSKFIKLVSLVSFIWNP